MPVLRSDIELVELYTNEDFIKNMKKEDLLNSSIVVRNKDIKEKVNAADFGLSLRIPVILPEAFSEGHLGDDSDTNITFDGINLAKMNAALSIRTKGYETANVLEMIKPGKSIADIVMTYGNKWRSEMFEKICYSMLKGAFAQNIADDGGDVVFDNGTDVISWATIAKARALIKNTTTMIVMNRATSVALEIQHPELYLQANHVVGYGVATFAGMNVLIADDVDLPYDAAESKHTLYLFSAGAFIQEFSDKISPVVYADNKLAGKGIGKSQFIFRSADMTHLQGYSFKADGASEFGYTLAELEDPTLIERIVPKDNSVFVVIKTKIA